MLRTSEELASAWTLEVLKVNPTLPARLLVPLRFRIVEFPDEVTCAGMEMLFSSSNEVPGFSVVTLLAAPSAELFRMVTLPASTKVKPGELFEPASTNDPPPDFWKLPPLISPLAINTPLLSNVKPLPLMFRAPFRVRVVFVTQTNVWLLARVIGQLNVLEAPAGALLVMPALLAREFPAIA